MVKWHKSDINNRMYCNLLDGKKISMPRYYKNKIYDEYERITAGAHQRMKMLDKQNQLIDKYGNEFYTLMDKHVQQSFKQFHYNAVKDRNKI